MKKILFILFTFILYSCSVGDDGLNSHYEIIPVESAILPEELVLGEIYLIELTYLRPTTCHSFNNIYYVADSNERTVAIVTKVYDGSNNCEETLTELEASFNFKPTERGSYI